MTKLKKADVVKIGGIEVGGRSNKVLLALRAVIVQYDPAPLPIVMSWLPYQVCSHIAPILADLEKKGLIKRGKKSGRIVEYTLTDDGAALVDPKTGPLSRRSLSAMRELR